MVQEKDEGEYRGARNLSGWCTTVLETVEEGNRVVVAGVKMSSAVILPGLGLVHFLRAVGMG